MNNSNNNIYAPIVLFVFNRIWHTQQTVSALQNNILSKESDLIIFSDGANSDENVKKINEIRQYIKTISGFKSIKIIERESNWGLAKSIINGVTEIVNQYEKIIVLEDDIVTSPYFLLFMNDALTLYKNDDEVISISGYIYPIKNKLPTTFFIKGADCWGWATWKRGWDIFEKNGQSLLTQLETKNLISEFNYNNSTGFSDMLKAQISGQTNSWAIRWYASAFLKNKFTLYPGLSLIQNIGNDNSGTNCINTAKFKVKLYNYPLNIKKIRITENKKIIKYFIKYFKELNKKKESIRERIKKISFFYPLIKVIRKYRQPIQIDNNNLYGWFGNYTSWEAANNNCSGYNNDEIFEKVKSSLLKVKNGQAVYERDSVIFNKIEYSFPTLAGLMWIAAQEKGVLNVLDYGGSLGSTYFQNRLFLNNLSKVIWGIVEQPKFVKIGKEYFENNQLKFYSSIDEYILNNNKQTLTLLSVIQYIENPHEFLENICKLNFGFIIIDRTFFIDSDDDRLVIHKVPPEIYNATIPTWFFNYTKFIKHFENNYEIITDFISFDGFNYAIDNYNVNMKGFILKNKKYDKLPTL